MAASENTKPSPTSTGYYEIAALIAMHALISRGTGLGAPPQPGDVANQAKTYANAMVEGMREAAP